MQTNVHEASVHEEGANEEARAMAISPRPPEGVRGPFILQQEPVGEVGDDRYQPAAQEINKPHP